MIPPVGTINKPSAPGLVMPGTENQPAPPINDPSLQGQDSGQATVPQEKPKQQTAVPDEWKSLLTNLLSSCELEDEAVHYAWVRKAKRLELYFNNIVTLFWDNLQNDWSIPNWDDKEAEGVPPRIINIYRPHGESIIAALTVGVPSVLFFPADADNADDIDKAENFSSLAKLVQKHNKAKLLYIKILSIFFNQGTPFVYSYSKTDRKFGYYQTEETALQDQTSYDHSCPICGYDFGELDTPDSIPTTCVSCQQPIHTEVTPQTRQIPVPIQVNKEKARVIIDPFGVLNVKVPYSARTQEHCGFLILKFDQSIASLRSIFCIPGPNGEEPLVENITASIADTSVDAMVRYPSVFLNNTPQNTAVVRCVWYRPWQFELIVGSKDGTNREEVDAINKKYPMGCYVIYIGNEPVEINGEDMDDHWTMGLDPRSASIHGEPLGTNLAMIQDINAEIDELELQTMEHGISELFIASDAIDFNKYANNQAKPGNITQTFKEPGKNIGDNFFETRTASLSPEVAGLTQKYKNLAEFVTGDFPTVYGGSVPGTSTATEYTKSQNQALQRLGTISAIASQLWADVIDKAVKEYAEILSYDEKLTEKNAGGYQTTNIDHMALKIGDVGACEPEFSELLPISSMQIKDTLMQLVQSKDPMLMAMLSHPQNNELIKKALGVPELYIPGINDRTKQYREISLLLQQQPAPSPNSPLGAESSIPPEEFDDHNVEMEVCKVWLNSSKGQKAKTENPPGYQNVVLHWKAHQMMLQMKTDVPNETPPGVPPDTLSTGTGG
jgi:hypothetical protein